MMSNHCGHVKTMVATLVDCAGVPPASGLLPELDGFHDLSLSRRPRRRWHVRRGDDARGRKRSGKCARGGARWAAGAVGDGQYRGLTHQPEDSTGGDGPFVGILRLEAPLLRRHSAFAAGGADHFHTQGTRAVAAHERSGEVRCDPARRFAAGDLKSPRWRRITVSA